MLTDGTVKDPRVEAAMATITEVEVSPDLQHARAFVSVFTDDIQIRNSVMAGLAAARPGMQRALASRIAMRYTPKVKFEYDGSIEQGARIEALLDEIREDRLPEAGADTTDDGVDADTTDDGTDAAAAEAGTAAD